MIFEQITDPDNLREAWQHVRSPNLIPGIDRMRCSDFEKNLEYNLQKLQKQLKKQTYRPLPVIVFKDHKRKKSGRKIGIACVRDKVVQQAILRVIQPHFEKQFLPCAYAYRPGRSALAAVNKAGKLIKSGHLWLLQMDVLNFFDQLDHTILLDIISRVIDEKPVLRLLSKLLKAKIFRQMGLFDNVIGSHQGSGLSPLLSNIYLYPMDHFLWDRYHECYLRYSDDISVFADDKARLEKTRGDIIKCLTELKLKPHPQKFALTHVASGVIYLGFHLDAAGKGPARKSVDQLHLKLEAFAKVRRTDDIDVRIKEVTAIIGGWFNYYQTLNPIEPANILTLLATVKLALDKGQNQLARRLLKKSVNFKTTHPDIAFRLGELFEEQGQINQAMREYANALKIEPELEKAKAKIRRIQEDDDDLHATIKQIQLVLHRNPHFREGYEKLAACYTELGLFGFAEKAHQKALELDDSTPVPLIEPETPAAETPFDYQSIDLKNFEELLKGRQKGFARQWVDERGRWGFIRVDRPLKTKDIYKHVKGDVTLAVYPVTVQDAVYFIVFDVDAAKRRILETGEKDLDPFRRLAHQDILRIKIAAEKMGFHIYIEDSGYKGRHGWLFFTQAVAASRAIQLGREIMQKAGEPSQGMVWELFPMGKSERHKSQIKLPLGVNRKNNRRCLFLNADNRPIKDQNLLLKTIRKNNPERIDKLFQEIRTQAAKEPMSLFDRLPPGLKRMADQCKVIHHLIAKSRDTNYLTHYERLCLLYTLTFAGEEGCALLHKAIGFCINYDPNYTQRQIDRRKESPIGCAKIGEYFPELAQTLPCDCKFDLPPRSYPSPVLYLLEAEMAIEGLTMPISRQPEKEEAAKQPDESVPEESDEAPLLDFELLFATETKQNAQADPDETIDIQPLETDQAVSDIADQRSTHSAESVPPAKALPIETEAPESQTLKAAATVESTEIWELALTCLNLGLQKAQINNELEAAQTRLKNCFAQTDADVIHTPSGDIRFADGCLKLSSRTLIV